MQYLCNMDSFKTKSIVLFDGACNFCNSAVIFIIRHDKKFHFIFASLQSDVAKEILLQFSSKKIVFDSIVLIENNKIYSESTAVLRILKNLSGGYKIMYVFIIVPKFIRKYLYKIFAKNRYRWFGKKENCIVPSQKLKKRFLDFK